MGLELPEIQNISKQMESTLIGKTISNVLLSDRCSGIIKLGMCNLHKRKDDKNFTYSYFTDVLSGNKNKPVKALLGLQSDISGLGNVYINDILYEAKLHPKKKVSEIKGNEKGQLYKTVVEIIKSAIELNGSSQEFDLFGRSGRYIRIMDKESVNNRCKRCGTRIIKMNILGSSSYICPECQKI